ncbi:MAG: CPBP family intramembrane metalloprotease [Planctomycetes bacterium]|nr:CPBP family intramembrane metalloprotease [Planctomycetota bacterium]
MMTDRRPTSWSVLVFAMVFPTVVTLAYFVLLADYSPSLQQTAYTIGKAIQFAFPAVWVFLVLREKLAWKPPNRRGAAVGVLFGGVILAAMFGLYHWVLAPIGVFGEAADGPTRQIRDKVQDLGLDAFWKYASLGTFYALCHSALEEYYWRWFVFKRLRERASPWTAIVVSSCAFMGHHVILLATFFGWVSPWTYLFSLAVAVGGIFWAWLYERTGSLCGPWLSHVLVDAAIFTVGYDIVKDMFAN